MVFTREWCSDTDTNIFPSLVLPAVVVLEGIAVVGNVALDSLKSPDKVQMPHGFRVFSIRQDVNTLSLLLSNNLLDVSCLRLMVAWEAVVEGVLNIIAVLNFCLILAEIFWAQKRSNQFEFRFCHKISHFH